MTLDPIKFTFELSELPESYKDLPKNKLKKAVSSFFIEYFSGIGGETIVDVHGDYVTVQWFPISLEETETAIQKAVTLLKQGELSQGEIMLSEFYKRFPEHPDILFNYGMILSDKGQLNEAIEMLSKFTEIVPKGHQGWNALAVAYIRKNEKGKALSVLQKSYQLNSDDPYTLRNLGSLLANESVEQALPYLEKAAHLLPEDPQTQYGYGLCLKDLKRYDEADPILKRVVELSPYTELAELAKTVRSEIAGINMRKETGSQPRMDAMMYCLAALEKYKELGTQKAQTITYEIAMLGRNGLDINNPERKYTLKSLPGEFTGMQLISYMFVGLKQINPKLDPGIDLEKEYKAALNLINLKQK